MLKIKLVPAGKKNAIKYRIAVSEAHSKITGKQTAYLGFYHPQTNTLSLDKPALKAWQAKGAQISTGLAKIIATWKNSSNS